MTLPMPLAVPPVRAIRMPVMPEYANQSDAALMSRLEPLDELAFAEIYDRYAGLLYGVALRVCRQQPTKSRGDRARHHDEALAQPASF